ncbi:hypothetical protein DICPUDRAFT_37021 [Dictyostelium purpureum]|uniref:Aminotransferase class I/classII large domain-containing protein n=1 Tax=Dictyostelium purpureum TaxID=5786 RepID=F0ZS33_DICPU|nr:uncharacterized protein DICPUDRAFT_37021 [Dictyostelium purpureum]EGC33234.1 hypothetical protein DICPUDRAFT_37021 [Dictyostelium purpureum]|eukprot:XP_003290227.1 hypothetical protein DICPUDRAFT_37021 [Dictyostelium purpureum]
MSNPITDYSSFISKRGKLKSASPIRSLFSISSLPGMVWVARILRMKKVFKDENTKPLVIEGADLDEGLQYSATPGLPKLNQWLRKLQIRNHSLPEPNTQGKEWDLIISNGSQESLYNTMEVLLDDGNSIITETPTYSGTLSILKPLALNIVGIETDKYGMIPEIFEKTLSEWDHSAAKFPRVVYIIPSGQNPCGSTMNNKRKQDIYKIASKYNLIILEDDPYFYLQFDYEDEYGADTKLGRSFLSMDTDGRVLRFDSLSKILSSGLRLGFVTGNRALLEKINFHQQSSTLHASGVSQMIVQALLTQWGFEQWDKHLEMVQSFYREKRNQFVKLLEKHLSGLVEYNIPSAGMFVWIRLLGIQDSKSLIFEKAVEKKVILVPGVAFKPDNSISPFVRASFSTANEEQMDEALKRLSALLNEELNKKQ